MSDPSGPFGVLVVCTANICRSPVAQQLLLMELDKCGVAPGFRVTSAGTHGYDGLEMDPSAAAELHRLGGETTGVRSSSLTDHACDTADLILTATREHRSIVLDRVPRAFRRTFTILEFAEFLPALPAPPTLATTRTPSALVAQVAAARGSHRFDHYDVADPFGGTADIHREVAETISDAVKVIAAQLAATLKRGQQVPCAPDGVQIDHSF